MVIRHSNAAEEINTNLMPDDDNVTYTVDGDVEQVTQVQLSQTYLTEIFVLPFGLNT